MNNKNFLLVHSGIYTLFAVALFFLPNLMWPIYGVKLNDEYSVFLSQHTSIFLGGIAIISFFLRKVELKSDIALELMKALMFTNILGFIITFYAGVIGIFVGLGWSDPIFFAFLSFISFIQMKKNK